MKTLLLPLALLTLSFAANKSVAQPAEQQQTEGVRPHVKYQKLSQDDPDKLQGVRPTVILVQLPTEQNRIDAMARSQKPASLEEVKRDAEAVRNSMMRDFTDNFSFCPVFYFMDKDLDKVKNQNFAGILFDKDMRPISEPGIGPGSKDYVVVRYGKPDVQPHRTKVVTDSTDLNDGIPMGRGLVVSNYKLQQVKYVTTYDYKRKLLGAQKRKEYYYSSKHFQIAYFPLAKELDSKVPRIYE